MKRNLAKTEEASEELAVIALAKAPAELKPEAEAIHAHVRELFKKAKTSYAGATGGENLAEGEDDSD